VVVGVLESLRLYALAQSFNTLPSQGGVYDQDPELLFQWSVIAEEYGKVQKEKQDEIERNRNRGRSPANKTGGHNFHSVKKVPPVFNNYFKQEK
jgi:hypothetical protein